MTKEYAGRPIRTIRADILPFSLPVDPLKVRSASDYIILLHLVRPLTRLSQNTQVESDLASSWEISDDYRVYEFKISQDAKYSNGEPILANHVKLSIERQTEAQKAIHFDFSKVKSVEASGEAVTISFYEPRPDFLSQTHHPEFGVLHPSDLQRDSVSPKFLVASGPYVIEEESPSKNGEAVLLKNNFYPKDRHTGPDHLTLKSLPESEKFEALARNEVDFILPMGSQYSKGFSKQMAEGEIEVTAPHIGFTYWVSINPNRIKNKSQRNYIQTVIRSMPFDWSQIDESWKPADQLYLPDGSGRPSKEELREIWEQVAANAQAFDKDVTLRLLMDGRSRFGTALVEVLEKHGISVEVETYNTQGEFAEYLKQGMPFDLFTINNDFSSMDLTENLRVTFGPVRPLVLLSEPTGPIQEALQSLESSAVDKKHSLFKQIGSQVLLQGLVAPLAYDFVYFYHGSHLDLSEWSKLYPEVAFWKLKAK